MIDDIGELPPANDTVLDFINEPGDTAEFVVVAGAASPSDFVNAVSALVDKHVPAAPMRVARIPAVAGCCDVTLSNGEVLFMRGEP